MSFNLINGILDNPPMCTFSCILVCLIRSLAGHARFRALLIRQSHLAERLHMALSMDRKNTVVAISGRRKRVNYNGVSHVFVGGHWAHIVSFVIGTRIVA
jgi:hypothetical protein